MGASNAGGVGKKWQFLTIIWLQCMLSVIRPPSVIHTTVLDRGRLVTLLAGDW